MIRMSKRFVSCQGNFANIVQSKLPQLTVLGVELILKLSRYTSRLSLIFFCHGGTGWQALLQLLIVKGFEGAANVPDRSI